MKNFVLFFEEKEGSTAIVQTLDALGEVSVVRRETESGLGGWEPFEWFNCGSLGSSNFRQCLHLLFAVRPLDFARLNRIYTRTARSPLRPFDALRSVGFKMRISPPWDIPGLSATSPLRRSQVVQSMTKALRRFGRNRFKSLMAEELAALDVTVFIMARQDVFRWAISKYHGDGTGSPGHLQFKLADGDSSTKAIPKIHIDPIRFARVLDKCVQIHEVKRWWADAMDDAGVVVHPLRYEDFLGDRTSFFKALLGHLQIETDGRTLEDRLEGQTRLKRVHGSDISEYVTNHREITDRFGDRFVRW